MIIGKTDCRNFAVFALLLLTYFLIFPLGASAADSGDRQAQQLRQKVRTNSNDLTELKGLLESNSVKLYETLIRLEELDAQSVKYSDELKLQDGKYQSIQSRLNNEYEKQVLDTVNASGFWLFVATMLVFLMPLGFLAFEWGRIRSSETASAGMKHLIIWATVFLVYFVVGFGLMFGESKSGVAGSTLIFLMSPDTSEFFAGELRNNISPGGFFLFQLAFAMVCVLIVSGALSNRLSLFAYGFIALCMAGVVYPLFGHWAWSGQLVPENKGFLEKAGFIDFAGATVIHSLAAWFALVWAKGVKAPSGEKKMGASSTVDSLPDVLIFSVIGLFMLWFGWVGMVTGSHLQFDSEVVPLVLNISLSGAAAGIAMALLGVFWGGADSAGKSVPGAVLGGFVAASAACDRILPVEAIVIGALAGLIYPFACSLLKSTLLENHYQQKAVGVIAAHGFCGVWGTLSVPLFGSDGLYLFDTDSEQLAVQLEGIGIAFVFSVFTAYMSLQIYRVFSKSEKSRMQS